MSTHNICFGGEIRKYFPDTFSYLELHICHTFLTKLLLNLSRYISLPDEVSKII